MRSRMMFSSACTALVALAVVACGPSEEIRQQLAELPVVTAEKDRLQAELDQLQQSFGAIASELQRLREPGTVASMETAGAPAPDAVRARVGDLVMQVTGMEDKLADAQTRLRSLNATTQSQKQKITEMEQAIANERAAIEGHRQTITALEAAVGTLEQETARMNAANEELTRTVEHMTDEANTVRYVVGTKEELLGVGIVREEGGSRVLFVFGKRGKTLVPTRNLDPMLFTVADLRTLTEIPLPDTEGEAKWILVTPQDLAAIETPIDERGRLTGDALRITDPQRFWANSRYLIVVRS